MAKLGSQGVGGSAEKCGEIPLEPFGGGRLIRLQSRFLDRHIDVRAFALARSFWGPSHFRSLPWHGGDFERNGVAGQRKPGSRLTYCSL
jgi:hypothetical protein